MRSPRYNTLSTFLAMFLLSACGGGGGGTDRTIDITIPSTAPTPLLGGGLLVFGPVPAGNALVIGEVTLQTNQAMVTVNGQPGTLQSLQPGNLISVIGSTSSGQSSASEIIFGANIIGPVDTVDVGASRVIVMGQTVAIDEDSILSTPLQSLSHGDAVQVSGYTAVNGETVASRIDRLTGNQESRLLGSVSGLDLGTYRFSINGLSVDYSAALTIEVPGGQLSERLEVLVTGTLSAGGVFNVSTIEHYDRRFPGHAGAQIRAEGRVTDAISGVEFSVNGFPIVMGGQRDYRQGSSNDIVVGAKVRVEGEVLSDGILQIHRVWFLHE